MRLGQPGEKRLAAGGRARGHRREVALVQKPSRGGGVTGQAGAIRHGVARALLDAAFRDLREEGAACIFLEVRTQNAPARALYTSLGFTQTGVRKGFYKNPADDAVLMKKPL